MGRRCPKRALKCAARRIGSLRWLWRRTKTTFTASFLPATGLACQDRCFAEGLQFAHRSADVPSVLSWGKRTGKDQLWTSAYDVGTAGAVSLEVTKRYIMQCQGK